MKTPPVLSSLTALLRKVRAGACPALLLVAFAGAAQAETRVFDANGSFVVPSGVTSVTVEVWAGGGGGGSNSGASSSGGAAGGGGGGGGYAKRVVVPVTPGQSYSVTVGTGGVGGIPNGSPGTDSSFTGDGGVTVLARGGLGGVSGTGGNGGSVGIGDSGMTFAGGKGGNGSVNAGGGGGGAAQLSGAGTAGVAGSGVTGGNGGSLGGGKGGNKNGSGQNGSSPGAGGGGNGRDGAQPGSGSAGRVVLVFTEQVDAVQTGLMLDETHGFAGGGMIYRPLPGLMNNDGSYSFKAIAKVGEGGVTVHNDNLMLTNSSGSLRVVAREGDAVANGQYLNGNFQNILLTPMGRTITMDTIRSTVQAISKPSGAASLISPDGITLELLKQTGQPTASGAVLQAMGSNVVIDDADRIYYVFKKAGAAANADSALDYEQGDGANGGCLAVEGQDVRSLTGDAAWLGQISAQISAGGECSVILTRLQNNPANKRDRTTAAVNEAVFEADPETGLTLVLRKGLKLPEAGGASIASFLAVSCSGNGQHALLATLGKPAPRTSNQVLIHELDGEVKVAVQVGVTEIVAGLSLARMGEFYATNDGAIVFAGWLGRSVPTADGVLCRWTADGGIQVLAREGDAAPSTGRTFHSLSRFSVSPAGAILLQAQLGGTGLNGVVYRYFGGILEKVVQTGEEVLFEGSPTEVLAASIYSIGTGSGGGGGSGESINDAGQAFIALSLGNGRHVNRLFE